MRNDGTPPSSHDPPELELAKHVVEYTCLARHDPGRFARDYRETRERFWALLVAPLDLRFFGSDFFDDLLAIVAHREVAGDAPREAAAVLRRAGQLRALRRFQAGDFDGGLAALEKLCGAEATGGRAALDPGPAGPAEPLLTPPGLLRLANRVQEREPACSGALRELLPLLSEDPAFTTGPRLGIVFHLSAADARHHPGYGILAVLELESAALDRADASALRIGGVRVPVNAPFAEGIWDAIRGASVASRAAGGPDLLHGIDFGFRIRGIPGQPTGESASLAFALLALWIGGCTWRRQQLVPPPGSAAMGIVHADGNVHPVFEGALRAKLRRLRESGVRRLYVPESQRAACDGLLHEGAVAAGGAPRCTRHVEVVGVDRLERAPRHEAPPQAAGRWLRQRARRYRLPILLGASLLFLAVVLTMVVELRIELREVRREGNVLTGNYRWGRPRSTRLGSAFLLAPPAIPNPKIEDLDADGTPEVLVVSMQASGPSSRQGIVRVDVLDDDLELRWTRSMDPEVLFAGGGFSTRGLTPELLLIDDWNGDGRREIFVTGNGLQFPSCTSVWGAGGDLQGQFVNPGHVKALLLVPGDGSRRDLVLLGECAEIRGCMVARLPAEFGITAFPSERLRLADHPPAPQSALFLEIFPALPRLLDPEAQIWPGSIEWLASQEPRIRISTLELAPVGSLLRELDVRLRQQAVAPTTAFLNDWRRLASERHMPALDGEEVTPAIETVRRWDSGVWREERLPAWNPGNR